MIGYYFSAGVRKVPQYLWLDTFVVVRFHGYIFPAAIAVLVFASALIATLIIRRRFFWAMVPILPTAVILATLAMAIRAYEHIGAERAELLQAMIERPGDPWPKGDAHVPLGRFGAREIEKGYLEPGGSFSPAAGSLGVSLWFYDETGRLLTTTDTIPTKETSARYETSGTGAAAIRTETAIYSVKWTADDNGGFALDVDANEAKPLRVEVVLRSVGPSGGRMEMIERRNNTIVTSTGWILSGFPANATWVSGDEEKFELKAVRGNGEQRATSASGWAFGRLGMPGNKFSLRLAKASTSVPLDKPVLPQSEGVRLDGIDPVFSAALRAQVATLKQGIVGDEPRPGDPLNYPLDWLRDGSYVIVALLRANEIDLARELAKAMAKKDFFGGFGSEADAPGLGLWTIGEVSAALDDLGFHRDLWPDVKRKANFLLELLQATGPTEHDFVGPVVPELLQNPELRVVAYGTRQGLIIGRMDWHRPLFYVNATAYAGLVAAAKFAEKLGMKAEAARWGLAASNLQRDWQRAFDDPAFMTDRLDERTAISGLWPFSIANSDAFRKMMEERRKTGAAASKSDTRSPWSYFAIAEAHQWLRLDEPEMAKSMLDMLWRQSPFPGLYTFSEGNGEENTFHLWETYRGWPRPAYVTPHYWSAAEALLLQLAMLAEAYTEEGGRTVLTIGGGLTESALAKPLHVSGVETEIGAVSWSWNAGKVTVHLQKPVGGIDIRLGKAFPKSTQIEVGDLRE